MQAMGKERVSLTLRVDRDGAVRARVLVRTDRAKARLTLTLLHATNLHTPTAHAPPHAAGLLVRADLTPVPDATLATSTHSPATRLLARPAALAANLSSRVVNGVLNSLVGGAKGLAHSAAGGAKDLAHSAAAWSVDATVAISHALLTGGRRELLLERLHNSMPLIAPPMPEKASSCRGCLADGVVDARFGLSRVRHHCNHCGGSFCSPHLRWRRVLSHKFTVPSSPLRVCQACAQMLNRESYENRLIERLIRCSDFSAGCLQPYIEVLEDTVAAKARRAGRLTLELARRLPLSAKLNAAVASIDATRKYGHLGVAGILLRDDLLQMITTLRSVGGDAVKRRPVHELTGALYYLMAKRRWQRGCDPSYERAAHAGLEPLEEAEMRRILEYAPLAMRVVYERSLVDVQRHASLHGYALLFAEIRGGASLHASGRGSHRPAFCMLGSVERREAVLVVRGTNDLSDVLTDSYAEGTPFCGGWAHTGMARAARWLRREVGPALQQLRACGYSITLAGHSLGAGVASLLAALLLPEYPDITMVGFATPSCASGRTLLRRLGACCCSVILRNDAVPRATLSSVRCLLDELAAFSEWRESAAEDWNSVLGRAKTLWAPNLRGAAGPCSPPPLMSEPGLSDPAASGPTSGLAPPPLPPPPPAPPPLVDAPPLPPSTPPPVSSASEPLASPPLESDDAACDDDEDWSDDEDEALGQDTRADPDTEAELRAGQVPDLRIPGRLVHLYPVHGAWHASHVPCDYPGLLTIQLAPHMLSDHRGLSYMSALRGLRAARSAARAPPAWVPFDKVSDVCACCSSRFSWDSTFQSLAQDACARHHCRGCGGVVCSGCSRHSACLGEIGIVDAVRVCDRCFFKL